MKCDRCPYQPVRSEAGDYSDCFASEEDQREFKDGSCGCKFTRKQLDRMQEEYSEYLGDMGTDMGVEDDFRNKGWSLQKALQNMMHMIGMWPEGLRHAYKRHGKIFYKPYRNYWSGYNEYLDYFSGALGIVDKVDPVQPWNQPFYHLTDYGLRFLGRHLQITIYPEED